MAISISSTTATLKAPWPKLKEKNTISSLQFIRVPRQSVFTKCESKEPSWEAGKNSRKSSKLEVGSPIVIIEAPKMIKTAASVPCLRVNDGLVKLGDVGRIMSRKPKDTWAVRLSIGTYLIDGKYFKPLELDESDQ